MIRRFSVLVAFAVLCLGCGSSGGFDALDQGGASSPATANLFVQAPPVTGQVLVQDASGATLAEVEATAGVASLALPPDVFARVETLAQGSSPLLVTFTPDNPLDLEAGPGSATFRATIPMPEAGDVVGVDPVSSMIANRLSRHPELSFEEAARQVFDYLGLPIGTNPEHLFEDTPFEQALFFAEAREAGGVDILLGEIESEIDQGSDSSARFLVAGGANPLLATLEKLAGQLKSSALEFVGGAVVSEAAGWLQGLIGFPSEPSIQQVLDAIDALRQDIARLSTQIDNGFRTQAYITKDQPLAALRAKVSEDNDILAEWASPSNGTPPTQAQITQKMSEIRVAYNGALTSAIQAELPSQGPSGSEPGLIGLYLDGTLPRFYGVVQGETAFNHLARALQFQQLILNLQVEAFHFERPSLLYDAERAIDNFFAGAKLQFQQYPLLFDQEHLLLDRGTKLLWTRRPLIIDDYRKIPDLLKTYTLGGTPAGKWRLPTAAEFDTLVSGTGGTGVDQNTNIGMKREGFLPVNGADQIGEWGIRPLNFLALVAPLDFSSPYATLIHVSNFRRSSELMGEINPYSGFVTKPYKVAFYLVREEPTVESITVSAAERSPFSLAYTATAKLSDGSSRDVTNLVIWSVVNPSGSSVAHDVARISNAPDDDGLLTLRVSEPRDLTVVATYKTIQGRLAVPSRRFDPPAIINIVISPVRYHVPSDGYPFSLAFSARTVRANGQLKDANTEVIWTSSDPSVQVSSSGLVTATRPATQKTVDVQARLGNIVQTSRVVLDP
jgi:hypothetical protein